MKERFFNWLLILLGFGAAGCNNTINIGREEYGTPIVSFTTKGRVVDAKGNPVKGLQVTNGANTENLSAGALTDGAGYFNLKSDITGFGIPSGEYSTLTIRDIDGEENGGKFAEKEVPVTFTESDKYDRNAWTVYYSKEVGNIVVDLEEPEE